MMESFDLHTQLVADFAKFEQGLNGEMAAPFHSVRRKAIEQFRIMGFPTVRHEEWKYTNIIPLTKANYELPTKNTLKIEDIPSAAEFIPADVIRVVLSNGIFMPEFSSVNKLPEGVTICGLNDAAHRTEIEQHIGTLLAVSDNAFTALNTAFARNGVFIRVAAGTILERPIAILYYADTRSAETLVQPRLLVEIERNAQATIIEHSTTIGTNATLVNAASEIIVENNASLKHYIIQDDTAASHITSTQIKQEADSRYAAVTLTLDGKIVRNTVGAELAGTNAETHFYGLVLGADKRLIDNHTTVDHAMPHCQSSELYKHILDDRSTAVFNGKVMVRKDAQKTNAYQSNRTILLSGGATINTKPQLEIFADDVKCSHGATSGYLDEEPLFYLRSRGISEDKAKALLLHAFAADVLGNIHLDDMREALDSIIALRLHDEE